MRRTGGQTGRRAFLVLAGLLAAGTLGCGYHFAGRVIGLPKHIQSIAVSPFENATFEPRLDDIFTRAVTNELIRDGRLQLVPADRADAVLTARIISYDQAPLSFDAAQRAREMRIRVRFDLALVERTTKKTLWKETGMETRPTGAAYKVVDSIETTKTNKDEALQNVARDFSEDLVARMFEAF